MFRFFYIIGLFIKYFCIYSLVKLNFYKKPQEKILRSFFEEAGGAFIKIGQLLSLRVDLVPKEHILELLNLLDNVKPFSYSQVKATFIKELGTTPEKLFKDFQKEPFASASFGQVHAAKLQDNTIMAVKILRPGIEQDVFIDFILIDIIATLADIFFNVTAVKWTEIAGEFKKWTKEELDYRKEAEYTEKIYQARKDNKHVEIPKIYPRFSTRRILVESYIEGIPLSKVVMGLKDGRLTQKQLKTMNIDAEKSIKNLIEELLSEYFFHGFFHADPHPGNILLLPKGRIGLVDFGIIGKDPIPNQKKFIQFMRHGIFFHYKEASYYFMQFAGEEMKQLIESALPANIAQEKIDTFVQKVAQAFADSVSAKVEKGFQDIIAMKTSWAFLIIQVLRTVQGYKIKVPNQLVIFARSMTIIDILGRDMYPDFRAGQEIFNFLEKYPEESFIKSGSPPPYRLNREVALERLNNWLSYLFEKDPSLYRLVNDYINKYNVVKS